MMKLFGVAAAAVLGLAALTACTEPADAPARDHAAVSAPVETASADADSRESRRAERRERRAERDEAAGPDPRDEPTPLRNGQPLWSATRRLGSQENADRAFARHGADFGAKDVGAYVDSAHAFLRDPPSDVLTLTRARNGDKLYYAPKANIFAVAREDGAPRTYFKPEEGMAYWREQEQREVASASGEGGERRAERRQRRDEDAG